MTLLFFSGTALDLRPSTWVPGLVALAVRVLTRRAGQPLATVPAHVALFKADPDGRWQEIEATVRGIRHSGPGLLPIEGVVARWDVTDQGGEGWQWALSKCPSAYGFAAAALTGIAAHPSLRALSAMLWGVLRAGRTAPLDCSELAAGALERAGHEVPQQATPISPNDLCLWMGRRLKTT